MLPPGTELAAGAGAASPSPPAPGRSHLGGRTLQLPVGTRRLRALGCASRAGVRGAGSCGAELGDKKGFWLGLAKAPGALLEPRGCGRHTRLSEPGAEQGCWGSGPPRPRSPSPGGPLAANPGHGGATAGSRPGSGLAPAPMSTGPHQSPPAHCAQSWSWQPQGSGVTPQGTSSGWGAGGELGESMNKVSA